MTTSIERRAVAGGVKLKRDGTPGTEDEGPGTLSGYAAVFHDQGDPGTEYELYSYAGFRCMERIAPGAFDRAIRDRDDCRCLRNHEPDQLLGRVSSGTLDLSVDARGLRYSVDLPDTTAGRDTAEMVDRGDMDGSSFGFIVEQQSFREESLPDGTVVATRTIESVELLDVSPVTYPAYTATSAGRSAQGTVRAVGGVDEARAAYEAWKATQAKPDALAAKIAQARARAVQVQMAE